MTQESVEIYWTIPDVAARLHAGESTVKRWLASGDLERSKAGGRTLITETAIQRFVKKSPKEALTTA